MLTRDELTGPWVALPVAWDDDDRFDDGAYRRCLENCCAAGLPGVVTGTTIGEFYALELDEFATVVGATIDECRRHDQPVIVGCSATSTAGVVRRARLAASAGAAAIEVVLPYWLELATDQVIPFFQKLAAAADGVPILYTETARAKKVLTVREHQELVEAVPSYLGLVADTDTVGTTPAGCQTLSRMVTVFADEELWSMLGPKGVRGSISLLAAWNPVYIRRLWDMFGREDWIGLGIARSRLRTLTKFLENEFRSRGLTDTAVARIGAHATGFITPGLRSRGPYRRATDGDVATLRQWLEKNFTDLLDGIAG